MPGPNKESDPTSRFYNARFRPLGYYNNIYESSASEKEKRSIDVSQRAINGRMLKQPLLNFNVLWRKFGGHKRFDPF